VYLVHVAILLRAINPRGHVATLITRVQLATCNQYTWIN
jgi:hypothetical protein